MIYVATVTYLRSKGIVLSSLVIEISMYKLAFWEVNKRLHSEPVDIEGNVSGLQTKMAAAERTIVWQAIATKKK